MKIKAAVIREKDKPFQFEEVDLQSPKKGEVLVKISASGVCHTDEVAQHQMIPVPLPVVLGHEGCGIVEGDSNPKIFIPQLISYYRQGRFPFDRLIRVFDFDQINEAFELSHSGKAIKALLKMN